MTDGSSNDDRIGRGQNKTGNPLRRVYFNHSLPQSTPIALGERESTRLGVRQTNTRILMITLVLSEFLVECSVGESPSYPNALIPST